MEKEIIITDKEKGVLRITTLNERWYARPSQNKESGLPTYEFLPSSTWIASYYPKGIGFYKWLADKGWDEAEALKIAAGDKGSKVHYACGDIDMGEKIDVISSKYMNNSTGQPETLTIEEVECIMSYIKFLEDYKPQILLNEGSFFGEFYAGTIDKIFRIGEEIWILDIKTSKSIWEEYKMQISSYSHMDIDYKSMSITDEEWKNRKLFILQVGYKLNRAGYKLTEIPDKYDLFVNVAYRTWKNENPDAKPKEAEYPLILKSDFRISQLPSKKEEMPPPDDFIDTLNQEVEELSGASEIVKGEPKVVKRPKKKDVLP
ncbi:MAG: chromosomal replication initiator protein [Siphoviridae sp. cttb18]|nr:MAG: chromosomal replication initiator protein [Siphoviridae sp. cttb18]